MHCIERRRTQYSVILSITETMAAAPPNYILYIYGSIETVVVQHIFTNNSNEKVRADDRRGLTYSLFTITFLLNMLRPSRS